MKRSDMLLKIMESLLEAPEDIEEAAEYLLTHIEKNGMMPPLYSYDYFGDYSNGCRIPIYTWESE